MSARGSNPRSSMPAAQRLAWSRRRFLDTTVRAAGAGLLPGLAGLGALGALERAQAATNVSGYKALVCLYLNGGNDGFNWLVPVTAAAYQTYAGSRTSLALANNTLLPLTPLAGGGASDGNTYGLHPSCPELQTLFNGGQAAFVCNVGTLVQPLTVAQAQAGTALPPQLFSHADQTTEWMTSYPQSPNRTGWGGRIADLLVAQGVSPKLAFNVNVGGANYWQEGQVTNPYVLGTSGAPTVSVTDNTTYRGGARARLANALLTQAASDPNLMVQQYAAIWGNATAKVAQVNAALGAAGDLTTAFPSNPNDWDLGLQLHEVARVIKAQAQIGDARQMFFVQMGGFDTHSGELATQAALLGYVSRYVNAFLAAMTKIGQQNNVTLFTISDFGRTLTTNAGGADHGWGSHHLVAGGAVKGGKFYGRMPSLMIGGADDFGQGRIVPTTSTDQYAATLANWFGVAASDLAGLFPNLANFSAQNLGFV